MIGENLEDRLERRNRGMETRFNNDKNRNKRNKLATLISPMRESAKAFETLPQIVQTDKPQQ